MSRVERWERRAEWPLMVSALLFLLAYAAPIIVPTLPRALSHAAGSVVGLTWALFAVDYVMRLVMTEHRTAFIRRNLLDLVIIALPLLRPLRLLRLVTLLSVLNRTGSRNLRGRVITYVTGGAALLLLCGALAVTDAERAHPDANITDFGDGLWWAITTMATVGYGDRYPTTTTGRFVAAALMVGGIALLGAVTAALASWLVESVAEANEAEAQAVRDEVAKLTQQIRSLEEELARTRAMAPSDEIKSTGHGA